MALLDGVSYKESILETIGNTPLVKLNKVTRGLSATLLGKVEFFNPGGSVKDRIGIKILDEAERKGLIKPGGTIVESTSGNPGMGLAIAAAVKGYRAVFRMPDQKSLGKVTPLEGTGAGGGVEARASQPRGGRWPKTVKAPGGRGTRWRLPGSSRSTPAAWPSGLPRSRRSSAFASRLPRRRIR